jgi:hypothetical protein
MVTARRLTRVAVEQPGVGDVRGRSSAEVDDDVGVGEQSDQKTTGSSCFRDVNSGDNMMNAPPLHRRICAFVRRWQVDVEVHPIDAVHLEHHMIGQDIGDAARYRHGGLRWSPSTR